jgi:flavin reductase (DIM6/NTAB) family NADH-FMN oxidoreductase RutF
MKKRIGPVDKIIPIPIALVVSGSFENPNITTVGKVGIVASDPPVIAISLRKDRYSLELIRKTKEFSVNTPSSQYFRETDYCGLVSGRDYDKLSDIGMTPLKGSTIDAPLLEECPYNLECKVRNEIVLGDWILLLADICEVYIDEDKLLDSEKGIIDEKKVAPLVYCGFVKEYRVLGEAVGRGFSDGWAIKREK